jgi:hypothetical protein
LVLLGTTSLYGNAPSQYNRVRMPTEAGGGSRGAEIRFIRLGRTTGFGSYHFSAETVNAMEILLARHHRGREVNSIFGEGVNPKLRKVRAALDELGLPSDLLLQHGQPRVVYGIPLAANFREVLLGREQKGKYLLPRRGRTAEAIGRFWTERWLGRRIEDPQVLAEVTRHSLTHPITHGARVPLPEPDEEPLPLAL